MESLNFQPRKTKFNPKFLTSKILNVQILAMGLSYIQHAKLMQKVQHFFNNCITLVFLRAFSSFKLCWKISNVFYELSK